MQIRELKYKDCLTLAKLIKKLADKIGSTKILETISADKTADQEQSEEKKESQYVQVGVELLQAMIQYITDDVNAWFADLIGCTEEELLEKSFDTPFLIVTQIIEAADSDSFFTTLSHLFKKIEGCGSRYKILFQK